MKQCQQKIPRVSMQNTLNCCLGHFGLNSLLGSDPPSKQFNLDITHFGYVYYLLYLWVKG